jgi:hypothetical protein
VREEQAEAQRIAAPKKTKHAKKTPEWVGMPLWEMKTCPRCKEEKHASEFGRLKDGSLYSYCKPCHVLYGHEQRKKHPHQPGARQGSHLKRSYGITRKEYDALFASQGGVCAICRRPEYASQRKDGKPSALAVDHDHQTGDVRGLLCAKCNQGIGALGDTIECLEAVVLYLKGMAKVA